MQIVAMKRIRLIVHAEVAQIFRLGPIQIFLCQRLIVLHLLLQVLELACHGIFCRDKLVEGRCVPLILLSKGRVEHLAGAHLGQSVFRLLQEVVHLDHFDLPGLVSYAVQID